MDLIWLLPAGVLATGGVALAWRLRTMERQVAAAIEATARVEELGAAGRVLTDAVADTHRQRVGTAHAVARATSGRPGGPNR